MTNSITSLHNLNTVPSCTYCTLYVHRLYQITS